MISAHHPLPTMANRGSKHKELFSKGGHCRVVNLSLMLTQGAVRMVDMKFQTKSSGLRQPLERSDSLFADRLAHVKIHCHVRVSRHTFG